MKSANSPKKAMISSMVAENGSPLILMQSLTIPAGTAGTAGIAGGGGAGI